MKYVKFNIEDMHCKSCETLIKMDLEELDGIKDMKISHEKGFVKVEFDDSKVDKKKIKAIITGAGYKVK